MSFWNHKPKPTKPKYKIIRETCRNGTCYYVINKWDEYLESYLCLDRTYKSAEDAHDQIKTWRGREVIKEEVVLEVTEEE